METNGARVFIRTPDASTFREVELPAALEAGTEVRIGVPVPDNVTYVTSRKDVSMVISRADAIGQLIDARCPRCGRRLGVEWEGDTGRLLCPEHGDDMLGVATRIVDGKVQFASDGLRSEDV